MFCSRDVDDGRGYPVHTSPILLLPVDVQVL